MDTDRSSLELLGHFDRPKRVISPDFDWDESDCGASEFDPAVVDVDIAGGLPGLAAPRPQPPGAAGERPSATIGVWFVLQWAAAVVVLAVAATVLFGFVQRIAVEHSLQFAARAGAIEASLPRASYESVRGTVERRLLKILALESWDLTLLENGIPVFRQLPENDGDVFSVTVTARVSSLVPAWLRWLPGAGGQTPIIVQAERRRPGRRVAPSSQLSAKW